MSTSFERAPREQSSQTPQSSQASSGGARPEGDPAAKQEEAGHRPERGRTSAESGEQDTGTPGPEVIKVDVRRAAIGGVLAAAVSLVGALLVGEASGAEARALLETSLPSTRSFCGTLTLALGNILALMLTLLSLSAGASVELEWSHYERVKQIAWIDTVVLVVAVLIYLLLNVPLGESDTASQGEGPWFAVLYYGSLAISSLLAGALIAIALMLYNTVRDIIRAIGPEKESRLVLEKEG